MPETQERKLTRTRTGTVVSDKSNKTIVVAVAFQKRHAKYGKYLRRHSKLHVHDENNECKVGDRVEVAYTRPLSKTKNWRLVRVIEKAPEKV